MRIVALRLKDADFERLEQERRSAGLPSVGALLVSRLGFEADDAVPNAICDQAIARGKTRSEPFILRELFAPAEWKSYSHGERLRAGRVFYNRVLAGKDGIAVLSTSNDNHRLYVGAQRRAGRRRPRRDA